MKERYIVTWIHDDYEHVREHTEDGFSDYDSALAYAKRHAQCVDNGRMVSYTSTIYQVVEATCVYQHQRTDEWIIEKED